MCLIPLLLLFSLINITICKCATSKSCKLPKSIYIATAVFRHRGRCGCTPFYKEEDIKTISTESCNVVLRTGELCSRNAGFRLLVGRPDILAGLFCSLSQVHEATTDMVPQRIATYFHILSSP